ncbi:ribonuclease HII [Piscibacillus halophilus]|uniref:Ribonuclease HII n=1 Tax=Piscibacillus halophilus TaxID=571933 RepID=A0A1H8YX43_9BACI|nr:ribonuclease HII [Piscibacillus halophilus]SEP56631.1 RNase HII [Piscibacillus halophilus]
MKDRETISVIKEKLSNEEFSHEWLESIKQDERKGVQQLLNRFLKQKEKQSKLHEQFLKMSEFETELYQQGFCYIAGVDEVGRGPLAGPVVTAAVVLPQDFYLPGINDSKSLSEQQRNEYYHVIQEHATSIGIGLADAKEIDYFNIYQATKIAMQRSIEALTTQPDYLLLDAMRLEQVNIEQQSIVKGDAKSISIAAASIIAKVERDRMMKEIGEEYPMYQFERNVGYGTKAHLEALREYGPTPYHRRSFQPVRQYT